MDWQQVVSLLVVAGTAGLFLWGKLRRRRFRFERDTHCGGCPSVATSAAQSSIVFRARKGQRPEVLVKMR